jgi:3-deoxy-manno-octulosonate cytidylyltransferase (CMP-KDO synthetase)
MSNKIYGIIPSRYKSTRFPGKPLALIGPPPKKPMYLRVYEQASKCSLLDYVVLATDDERIADSARMNDVPFVMTNEGHPTGTDRCLEAANILGVEEGSIIINIQGDQPSMHPQMLYDLIEPFKDSDVNVTTLMRADSRLSHKDSDYDSAKIVLDKFNNMMYMSRLKIPYESTDMISNLYIHVGICAFRLFMLRAFVDLGPSSLELIEGLEQLRFIENGIPIRVAKTNHIARGVDRPEDIPVVEAILRDRGL